MMDMDMETTISVPNTMQQSTFDVFKEGRNYTAYHVGILLHTYCLPVIVLVGAVFNIISMCVMLQASNRKISFCIYLIALSITDNLVLYSAAHYWFSSVVFQGVTQEECQVICAIFQMSAVSSTYLIVAVTVDRFLATCYPLTTTAWRTPKRAYIITAGVVVICALCNIPIIRTALMVDDYTCVTLGTEGEVVRIYAVISTILFVILPSVIILVLNCAIAYSIRKRGQALVTKYGLRPTSKPVESMQMQTLSANKLTSHCSATDLNFPTPSPEDDPTRSKLKDITEGPSPSTPSRGRGRVSMAKVFYSLSQNHTSSQTYTNNGSSLDRQLTKVLLTVSFTFLLLMLPQYIRYIVYCFVDFRDTAEHYALYVLVVNITNKLVFINSAINFVLYCISGRRFRKQLKLMTENKRCCIKEQ